MLNTVAVIEAGIGAVSLGFAEAGFQVTDVFIKDKKAVDIYKNNINGRIHECGLMELLPEEIPKLIFCSFNNIFQSYISIPKHLLLQYV